jgi:hypothetical protein
MSGKWVDTGENRVANILFGAQSVDSTLYLGIYTNSTEPAETATGGSLTEAQTPGSNGYARIALTRGTWTVTNSVASYAQQTFTASGAAWGACYGYFVTTTSSGTSGVLLGVESFTDGPYTINDGDTIKITPSITVS